MFSFVCNCLTNDLLYRVGSTFPSIAIACYDIHDNRTPFPNIPDDVTVELRAAKDLYIKVHGVKAGLSIDKMTLKIMVCIMRTSLVLLIEKKNNDCIVLKCFNTGCNGYK